MDQRSNLNSFVSVTACNGEGSMDHTCLLGRRKRNQVLIFRKEVPMRKKKTVRTKRRWWSLGHKKRRHIVIGSICAIVALGFGTVAGPYSTSPGSRRLRSLFLSAPPPPPIPPANSPSKEYIYAGGRLIATEEPQPLAAPVNLVASTFSDAQINLSWNATPNAHHYQVERASSLGGTFTVLNSNVAGTTFPDTTVSSVNAYLYRVKAADANGNLSLASNLDLATAITFEDDPLQSQTLVRAEHIKQLRQAINAVRHLTPTLQDYNWQQSSATLVGAPVMANDIDELRTALDEALNILGLPAGGYTPASLAGEFIQTGPITQLRDRVK